MSCILVHCVVEAVYALYLAVRWILDPLKMGPIGCPETPVRNYQYSLRNDPEERSSPDAALL